MRNNAIKDATFYQTIGKLFYAIAAIDGTVRKEEYAAFIKQIHTNWSAIEKIDQNSIHQMENAFKTLNHKNSNAQIYFDEFVQYKRNHEFLFSEEIKKMIWEISCAITSAVRKKNKSELISLVNLGKALQIM